MTAPDDIPPPTRSIELEVEVVGTPEEVWAAIATGPGITAWFVPSEVEPRAGGVVRQSFGPSEEMTVEGRVHAWEPPIAVDDELHAGLCDPPALVVLGRRPGVAARPTRRDEPLGRPDRLQDPSGDAPFLQHDVALSYIEVG